MLPSIGLPLPSIGLRLPDIGLPAGRPDPSQVDKSKGRSDGRVDRRPPGRRQPGRGSKRGARGKARTVFVFPVYPAWNYPGAEPEPASALAPAAEPALAPPEEPARPTGTLLLDLDPYVAAQVYVDSVYVGTIDDVGGTLALEAGTHGIELRAPGYEPLGVNVKVEAGRAITYRGALQPVAGTEAPASPEPAAPAASATRKPIYAIPGCYLGDVPPKEANLPPGCDPVKAITIKP